MLHVLRFEGGYERNLPTLKATSEDYEGEDGQRHQLGPWPRRADGIRYSMLEQQGKRFFVVRVGYKDKNVILHKPVRVDPDRHLGGQRFAAEPIGINDGPAGLLLGDIIDSNQDQIEELDAIREAIRADMKKRAPH